MIILLPPTVDRDCTAPTASQQADGGYILHARGREYYWEGEGPLSLKAFFSGSALYNVGGGCFAVDDSSYLVLNQGQRYAITIDAPAEVESLCVFFGPGHAADAWHALNADADQLLVAPQASRSLVPEFFERTYPRGDAVASGLLAVRQALQRESDPAALAELVQILLVHLLETQQRTRVEVASLPAARAATRAELYRRAHLARDYAQAMYAEPITLEHLARAASLSPTHLLRVFGQVFGSTPHQYLTGVRLTHARNLLCRTDQTITEICLLVGFQSLGSFSSLFRRHTGLSPAAFRRQFR